MGLAKRYLVVGCGGFIGSHLLDALLPVPGVEVTGVDLAGEKIAGHVGRPNFTFLRGRLDGPGIWPRIRETVRVADAVINLAAICNPAEYTRQPLATMRANALETVPLIDLCAEHGTWLVQFSTSEVYGRTLGSYLPDADGAGEDEFDEAATPLVMGPVHNQRWCYAAAKQFVERYVFAHGAESGMPWTIVRPFNFFGPRMDRLQTVPDDSAPRVLASFMSALIYGRPIQLVDGGRARRTVVAIDDAIDAVMRMLDRPGKAQGQIFNIGNRDNEVTIRALAHLMRRLHAEITNEPKAHSHPIVVTPASAFYGEGYEDCDRRMPRLDRARELLGWAPRRGLEDTLRPAMQYFVDEARRGLPLAAG